jgi:hypothetical protein
VTLRRWRSALIVLCLGATPAMASEPLEAQPSAADEDEAFDLGDDDDIDDASSFIEPSEWTTWLTGFLRSDWALWSERLEGNPLAKGRQSLDVMTGFSWRFLKLDVAGHVEYDVAYQVERDGYDAATIETYEWLVNTREVQLALSLGDFEITLGRQIVAWGEGDMLSPIDVLNPRDMREPGQSDLSDIRLPVLATRVGWFQGGHRLELMIVHESEFGYRSPPRGPYSGLDAMISSGLLGDSGGVDLSQMLGEAELNYEHVQPRFALEQQEVYLRWLYNGAGFDVGAYFASFLDPIGALSIDSDAIIEQVVASMSGQEAGAFSLGVDHQRYHMVGLSGAHSEESVLLKWEVSLDIQRPISVLAEQGVTVFGAEQRFELPGTALTESFNVMMGVTWSGVQNLTVGVEFLSTILLDEPEGTLVEMSVPSLAVRASYLALDERLSLSGVVTVIGLGQGWLARGDVSYDLLDTLKLGVGYVTYQPGRSFGAFYGLEAHDRLFAGLRWDFQVL